MGQGLQGGLWGGWGLQMWGRELGGIGGPRRGALGGGIWELQVRGRGLEGSGGCWGSQMWGWVGIWGLQLWGRGLRCRRSRC